MRKIRDAARARSRSLSGRERICESVRRHRVSHSGRLLTVLFVQDNLHLQFGLALQALVDHGLILLLRFRPVEELAGATLLHDLRPRKTGQLAEAIGAVDDRIDRRHLRISQYKVAVCEQKPRTTDSENRLNRSA